MSHMQNQGYAGSPRPHMMQHSGSHQGFNPTMMAPPQFAPSPAGQPHPYAMQQRQMSAGGGGYPLDAPGKGGTFGAGGYDDGGYGE